MILVTVGNMDPFDRLIMAVDNWLKNESIDERVIMQIGDGEYLPSQCEYVRRLSPCDYTRYFEQSRLVISHAGMGTIITALELGKPIVVMPKKSALGEQRNDHQLATVRRFHRSRLINVAESEDELPGLLKKWSSESFLNSENSKIEKTEWKPDEPLIEFVRGFICK